MLSTARFAVLGFVCVSFLGTPLVAADDAAASSPSEESVLDKYISSTSLTASREPAATTCMACSMNMPKWAAETGTVPMAVSNQLWFNPERGATCGMCLRIYVVPQNQTGGPACVQNLDATCAGYGSHSYADSVSQDFAYDAKLQWDPDLGMNYFQAVIIEWLDRNQTSADAISYPVKGLNTDDWGTWPVQYRAVPCPVNQHNMAFAFLNASSPIPTAQATNQTAWTASGTSSGLPQGVGSSLCNNEPNQPCGSEATYGSSPLAFIKLQIIGQRIPISAVRLQWQDGTWGDLQTSGDGYWQPSQGPSTQDPSKPIMVEVHCADGSPPKSQSLLPVDMLCGYQDPGCQPWEGSIQC